MTTETTPETMDKHSASIILTAKQAKLLAGLQHAASRDAARPLLRSILLEWDDESLTAVATDSYMMARRVIPLNVDGAAPEIAGSILVEAKPFTKALGEAAKTMPLVHIEVTNVDVASATSEVRINLGGGSVQVFRQAEGAFPKWERFYSDDPAREMEGLPALNRDLLDKAMKVAKGSPPVKSDIPFRLGRGTSSGSTNDGRLIPFRLDLIDAANGDLSIIIMPVKIKT